MSLSLDDNNLEAVLDEMRTLSQELAVARGNREYLQHFRQVQKALLMAEGAKDYGIVAVSAQESYAFRQPAYAEFLLGLQAAVEHEALLQHQLKTLQNKIDLMRTKSASQRAELKNYGAQSFSTHQPPANSVSENVPGLRQQSL